MTRVYELSATSKHAVETRDDRGDGGSSVATLEKTGGAIKVNCDLSKRFA